MYLQLPHKLYNKVKPDTFLDFATENSLIMAVKSISRSMSDSVLMI